MRPIPNVSPARVLNRVEGLLPELVGLIASMQARKPA